MADALPGHSVDRVAQRWSERHAKCERLSMIMSCIRWVPSLAPFYPQPSLVFCEYPLYLGPSLAEGRFFVPRSTARWRHNVESVAATAIPAAVHEALGVVARQYAAQLNNFSA